MEDKFDKILSNKIKEVFDNRDVAYNPEHWNMLIYKKGKKKKRVLFLWRFAGVALLFIMASSMGKFLFSNDESLQKNEIEIVVEENNNLINEKSLDNSVLIEDNDPNNNMISEIDDVNSKTETTQKIKNNTKIKSNSNAISISNEDEVNSSTLAYKTDSQKDSLKENIFENDNMLIENIVQNDAKIDSLENSKSSEKYNEKIDIEELIADQDDEDDNDNEEINKKSIKIGLNISPMINYIQENENSNIGFSSGVTVEVPILKKFDIYTGILYTNQKFNLYQQDNILTDVVSKGGVQLKSEESTMKGIEIPINVKYNFEVKNNILFVSAGFSSTSYFKENIASDYVVNTKTSVSTTDFYGNNIIAYKLVQSKKGVVTEQTPTDGFTFVSMLNLSFGMEFPIKSKQQAIVIEPYFKYSLSPITQREVDHTNVGFYLRYNFGFKRK